MESKPGPLAHNQKKSKGPPLPADTQRACIDLPGEAVRCYVHKPNLQIVLRKHRDVIFDIKLFKGMKYTVSSDRSDFYSVRDKRLVEYKKGQGVDFVDGERLHLWVSRQFSGHLILKAGDKVLNRYDLTALDPTRYGDDPSSKPAPLLIALKNEATRVSSANPKADPPVLQCTAEDPLGIGSAWGLSPVASVWSKDPIGLNLSPLAAETTVNHPVVAVVDAAGTTLPQRILDHFAAGGGKSGLVEVDPNEAATRNWLYGQLAGATAYAADNWNWLRHSLNRQADGAFRLVKAQIGYVRGKARIYFSGYSKLNPVFGQGGHNPGHAKVVQIFSGVGSSSSTFSSAVKGVAGTFKGNALISFIFGSAASWAEWTSDAQKDGFDLAANLLTGLVKALVAAALTVVIVAAVVALVLLLIGGTVAALVVGVLTVVVGFAANYAVEAADKRVGKMVKGATNSDGMAAVVAPWLRDASAWLSESWSYLRSKMPNDYNSLIFP